MCHSTKDHRTRSKRSYGKWQKSAPPPSFPLLHHPFCKVPDLWRLGPHWREMPGLLRGFSAPGANNTVAPRAAVQARKLCAIISVWGARKVHSPAVRAGGLTFRSGSSGHNSRALRKFNLHLRGGLWVFNLRPCFPLKSTTVMKIGEILNLITVLH